MKLICYGPLGDAIGRKLDFAEGKAAQSVGELRRLLANSYPGQAEDINGPRLKALVNEKFVGNDHPLSGCETVEFLPPVSGG